MNKQKKCQCGCDTFLGHESNALRGSFDEEGTLLLKAGEPLGVQDLKCEDCGLALEEEIKMEFV